ncbi:MAG: hypothetical protein AB1611_15035 [bacterium]
MKEVENYPIYVPILRNMFNLSLLGLGLWILGGLHYSLALLYGFYCLAAATMIMPALRCTRCYYHGRRCSTGFGLLAGLLYRKDTCHAFTEGIWHNVFLLPIGLFPLGGAAWRIIFIRDSASLWLGSGLVLVITGLLTEHACLGCRSCKELAGCPARWVTGQPAPTEPVTKSQ